MLPVFAVTRPLLINMSAIFYLNILCYMFLWIYKFFIEHYDDVKWVIKTDNWKSLTLIGIVNSAISTRID